jgi:hypothetical protein
MAAVEGDYDSGEDFHWFGDDDGDDYATPSGAAHKSNKLFLFVHLATMLGFNLILCTPPLHFLWHCPHKPLISPRRVEISSLVFHHPPFFGITSRCFAVTNTGATDHMFPDKYAFISYKTVANLQIQKGNNAFIPVLG